MYLGNGELGSIPDTKYMQVISAVNLGLTELYKRFPVRIKEVIIREFSHITDYKLDSRYAEYAGSTSTFPKYIMDSPSQLFRDDVLLIEEVFNEDGMEIPLNDSGLRYSIFITGYNSFMHPYPDDENVLSILYRANSEKILYTPEIDLNNTYIDVPDHLTEALLNYVAYRLFGAVNLNSAEATGYYAKFEASCNLLNNLGLVYKQEQLNMKLENNGWV